MLKTGRIHCGKCDYRGRSRREGLWLVGLAAIIWLVPLSFLSMGYWPFLLLPSIALTAWAIVSVRHVCPVCGAAQVKELQDN